MANIQRFHRAQNKVYQAALAELKAGRKTSHWMWFIFPQIDGLGFSETSRRFALTDVSEAEEYLRDPVLGQRLIECVSTVLKHKNRTPIEIFGYPDDLKFQSCMTLFEIADPSQELFGIALKTFYSGARDFRTIDLANRN